ncbi:hypothetical protein A2U01_0003219 [Trifolium medium]|uniref:Retroviral polymerase SH3-like domain-containing protein n=1 Tax=Trifolium medium TaxID=97028 RepID=A0A392M5P6_9FABA|nr:hypothetical protein [Trifolium medium]
MILVGYHPSGAYRLYDPIREKVELGRDVKVCELEKWDRKGKCESTNNPLLSSEEEYNVKNNTVNTEANTSSSDGASTSSNVNADSVNTNVGVTKRNRVPSTRHQNGSL